MVLSVYFFLTRDKSTDFSKRNSEYTDEYVKMLQDRERSIKKVVLIGSIGFSVLFLVLAVYTLVKGG